jgi:hypothetical protein
VKAGIVTWEQLEITGRVLPRISKEEHRRRIIAGLRRQSGFKQEWFNVE